MEQTRAQAQAMSNTTSSMRVVAQFLFLTMLTAAVVLATHGVNLNAVETRAVASVPRRVVAVIPKPKQAPAQPSAFTLEAAMTPSALMARWDDLISEAALKFGIPERWIRAVMRQESGGRTMLGESQPIVSQAGAIGLMQVMPDTYAEMRDQYGLGTDPANPHDNVFAGAAYLKWLRSKYGYPAMFAAYNAGPGALEDHIARGTPLPAETQAYIVRVAGFISGKIGTAVGAMGSAMLTRPDGTRFKVPRGSTASVRAAMPGEYADGVQSVVTVGKQHQGVRESVAVAQAAIGSGIAGRVRAVY